MTDCEQCKKLITENGHLKMRVQEQERWNGRQKLRIAELSAKREPVFNVTLSKGENND